jgi:hypothetical protein
MDADHDLPPAPDAPQRLESTEPGAGFTPEQSRDLRVHEAEKAFILGWSHTPLHGKKPVFRQWQRQPRTDLDSLRKWAEAGNIGIRTGQASGIIAIDDDTDDGSAAERLGLPATVTVLTGGGGKQHYYKAPAVSLGNSASGLAPHVDVRADGGQVVAVGCIHPETGRTYVWAPGLSPDEIALADLPPEMVARIKALEGGGKKKRAMKGGPSAHSDTARARDAAPVTDKRLRAYAEGALGNIMLELASTPEGRRNDALNGAAFRLGRFVGTGLLDRWKVEESLRGAATACGLESDEIEPTLASGLDAGAGRPIDERELAERLCITPDTESDSVGGAAPDTVPAAGCPTLARDGTDSATDSKPTVLVPGEHRVPRGLVEVGTSRFAIDVLHALPERSIYRRGDIPGELVGAPGSVEFKVMLPDRARLLVDHHVRLARGLASRVKRAPPRLAFETCTKDLAQLVIACATDHPAVATLIAITRTPGFAGRGFARLASGFNPQFGILYDEHPDLVGIEPIRDPAEIAKILDDLVIDFPFQAEVDRQNAIGLLLTPFVRPAVRGNLPLHLLLSSLARTGKTKFVEQVFGRITQGACIPAMVLTEREEEREKQILATMLAGISVVHLDNLPPDLKSPALSSLLTSQFFCGRVLGASKMASLQNDLMVIGSGNNVHATSELANRIIPIRLLPKTDRPEDRNDFVHPDLEGYLESVRRRVVGALLGMILNWLDAGRPAGRQTFGGFERFTRVVGGIMATQGYTLWLSNRSDWAGAADIEGADLRALVEMWAEEFGEEPVTPKQLRNLAQGGLLFPEILGIGDDHRQMTLFGKQVLRQATLRPVGNWRIVATGSGSSRSYRLAPLAKEGA